MSEGATGSYGGVKRTWALRVPWVVVLVLEVITRGWFDVLWMLVLANWVRKVRGKSTAFWWSIAYVAFLPGLIVVAVVAGVVVVVLRVSAQEMLGLLETASVIYLVTVRVFALFTLRMELAEAPFHLRTGYWRTILFGTIYLQYCLQRFAKGIVAPPPGAGAGFLTTALVDELGTVEGNGSSLEA